MVPTDPTGSISLLVASQKICSKIFAILQQNAPHYWAIKRQNTHC